jgi:NADPH2:quinone reductase
MKAAVLHEPGGIPKYQDFADPRPNDDQILIEMRAVAVENIDKQIAAGRHFAAEDFLANLPAIPCFDGVGALPDGTLVGFGNVKPPYGALAEKIVVGKDSVIPLPEGLDPTTSVVLASAISGMSMTTAAGLQPGETVLIQGATGVAGRLAVKTARLLKAGRIIATGRDDEALRDLNADEVINTTVDDEELIRLYAKHRADVVVDFLWGRPTELLLRALVPTSLGFAEPVRLVQVGESAGPQLTLPAESLRTSGVEIYGAAKGLDAQTIGQAYGQVVEWARTGRLTFDLEVVPLRDIETAWQRTDLRGRRLVVVP